MGKARQAPRLSKGRRGREALKAGYHRVPVPRSGAGAWRPLLRTGPFRRMSYFFEMASRTAGITSAANTSAWRSSS